MMRQELSVHHFVSSGTNFNPHQQRARCPITSHDMGRGEPLHSCLAALAELSPAQWCQTFFLFAAGGVAAVAVMPRDAKTLLVDYGARKAQTRPADAANPTRNSVRGRLLSLIAAVTSFSQVPHSWFSAFYAVSLGCSVFWLVQYLGDGAVLRLIASSQAWATPGRSATLGQVALGWFMMFLQAARRVYEHAAILKPSKSTMWVVHWLLGLFFYLAMSVSVWVEGSGKSWISMGSVWVDIRSLTAAQAPSWTRELIGLLTPSLSSKSPSRSRHSCSLGPTSTGATSTSQG